MHASRKAGRTSMAALLILILLPFIPESRRKILYALLPVLAAASLACGGSAVGSQAPPLSPTATEAPLPPTATPVPSTPTPAPTATAIPAADLPIIDLHFHPDPGWGDLEALFNRLNVRRAGNGASEGDSPGAALARQYPGRIVAFAGGPKVRQLVSRHGAATWNLENAEILRYLDELEEGLRDGSFSGIGEIHVNNWSSNIIGSPQYAFPADSPLVQRLFSLSARYRVPLSIHMDAEPQSVEEMERLLASNREGTFLWAHTGHYAEPQLLRRLFERHANLYCELSYRTSISGSRTAIPFDQGGKVRATWLELLEDYPDRFVIGTDLTWPSPSLYATHIAFWRGILEQLSPRTAERIAFQNAESLLNPLQ